MRKHKFNIDEVREFIKNSSAESKIYIGTDSERFKIKGQFWADYTTAVVIHYDGCKGCKVFGDVVRERDYDQKKDKPSYRLMNEVAKAASMYIELADAIGDRHFEIHLDINPDLMHGSSCVIQQAIGYIKGTCNITPMVKPDAFAASYAADRLKEIVNYREEAA